MPSPIDVVVQYDDREGYSVDGTPVDTLRTAKRVAADTFADGDVTLAWRYETDENDNLVGERAITWAPRSFSAKLKAEQERYSSTQLLPEVLDWLVEARDAEQDRKYG